MTWVELAVLLLVAERGFCIVYAFCAGVKAVWDASRERANVGTTPFRMPSFVEVESDEAMALDYSSKRRH